MTQINVTISDEGLPIVQAALDAHNDYIRREQLTPELTLEQFIQQAVEMNYGIKPEHLAARELKDARMELNDKLDTLDLKGIQSMSAVAADIGAKAEPIENVKP